MVQSGASPPRLRINFPPPVSAVLHCRPNVPPGNITLFEVQIGKTGAQMEEVRLAHASTFMRGHRPKERTLALIGESEEFSTQRLFQTLASSVAMGRTELPDFPIRLFPVFSMPLAIDSVSATQSRDLLVRNSSPRQKVHGDQ